MNIHICPLLWWGRGGGTYLSTSSRSLLQRQCETDHFMPCYRTRVCVCAQLVPKGAQELLNLCDYVAKSVYWSFGLLSVNCGNLAQITTMFSITWGLWGRWFCSRAMEYSGFTLEYVGLGEAESNGNGWVYPTLGVCLWHSSGSGTRDQIPGIIGRAAAVSWQPVT